MSKSKKKGNKSPGKKGNKSPGKKGKKSPGKKGTSSRSRNENQNRGPSTSTPSVDDSLFAQESNEETTRPHVNFSPSMLTGENSNVTPANQILSFRKFSMDVPSSLPMESDSDESGDESKAKAQLDKRTSLNVALVQAQDSVAEISSCVKSMSQEQIEEHISCCLQLNTENKINTKNAFALKLIDCMTELMKKTKDDESNFAAVACQLDAGAKIYSLRVDAVHQQVMKLAESCSVGDNRDTKRKGIDSDNEDGPGETSNKARRNKAKRSILAHREQITRKLKGKNPRDNYVQLEARPGGILNTARRDPKDLSLTLEKYTPFWRQGPGHFVGGFTEIPKIEIKSREIVPGLDMENCLKYTPNVPDVPQPSTLADPRPSTLASYDDPQPSTSTSYDDPQPSTSATYDDPQPSTLASYDDPGPSTSTGHKGLEIENLHLSDSSDDDDEDYADTFKAPERPAERESTCDVIARAEARMAEEMGRKPTRMEVMKTIFHFDGESDYNYLKMDSKEFWGGPSYWKRVQGADAVAHTKKTTRKKKEPKKIDFSAPDFDLHEHPANLSCKRPTMLSNRTTANWSSKKTLCPPDIVFELKTLFQLFHMDVNASELIQEPEAEAQTQPDSQEAELDNDGENDGNVFPNKKMPFSEMIDNVRTFGHTSDSDSVNDFTDDIPAELVDEEAESNIDENEPTNQPQEGDGEVQPTPGTSDGVYEGDNLVPMVKKVKVEPIVCVARPNRVDFQHLKEVMLKIIQRHIDNKENQDSAKESSSPQGSVPFRVVLDELFDSSMLQPITREDLSVPMAFFCLLTLTNEHSFSLDQPENSSHEDVIISYDRDI